MSVGLEGHSDQIIILIVDIFEIPECIKLYAIFIKSCQNSVLCIFIRNFHFFYVLYFNYIKRNNILLNYILF